MTGLGCDLAGWVIAQRSGSQARLDITEKALDIAAGGVLGKGWERCAEV